MKKFIILFPDALGYHYYSDNPQIKDKIDNLFNNTIPLEPVVGYSPGIHASIWTSNYPQVHGIWTQWLLNSKDNHEINFHKKLWQIDYLLKGASLKILNSMNISLTINPQVPFFLRNRFKLTQYKTTEAYENNNPKSFFSKLREEDLDYSFEFLPTSNLLKDVKPNSKINVYHIGSFDKLGHQFGPNSKELEKELQTLIECMEKLKNDNNELVLMSDHGMAPVNQTINVLDLFKDLELNIGEDYVFFIDSTMLRFWYFSKSAQDTIRNVMSESEFFHVNKIETGLKFSTNIYGDDFYIAKEGTMMYPNFWLPLFKNKLKGLHGYMPYEKYSYAIFSTTFPLNASEGSVLDISPTLTQFAGLKREPEWHGRNLLGKL